MGTVLCFSPVSSRSQIVYLLAFAIFITHLVISASAFISGTVIKCHNEGEDVRVSFLYDDPCIRCKCKNREIVCERACSQAKKCTHNGKTYKSGEMWNNATCNKCSCSNGEVKCQAEVCPQILVCEEKQRRQHIPGDCCPSCVEKDGICTLTGSGHGQPLTLTSFDASRIPFEGKCNYVVTRDCQSKTFSVHVVREASNVTADSLAMVVKVDRTKVRLYRGDIDEPWKLRVGRKPEQLPFLRLGVLSVLSEGTGVMVRTNIGVKVHWNGAGNISVYAPAKYKDKVCGLCGNYNDQAGDDLLTKKGRVAENNERFFNSWKVGKTGVCAKKATPPVKARAIGERDNCALSWEKKVEAMNACNILKAPAFRACHRTVSIVPYYKSCIADMCGCEEDKCHCNAVQSYVVQCQRIGLKIDSGLSSASCEGVQLTQDAIGISCPPGAIYTSCASPCRRSCRNFRRKSRACDKPCKPGCDCPAGLVWYNNRCVAPKTCPAPVPKSPSS